MIKKKKEAAQITLFIIFLLAMVIVMTLVFLALVDLFNP